MATRCHDCRGDATSHATFVRKRVATTTRHFCSHHALIFYEQFISEPRIGEGSPAATEEGRLFDLEMLLVSEVHDQQLAVLREVGGQLVVPTRCGVFEAAAIERAVRQDHLPRPMSHDAWLGTILALGGEVQDVWINEMRQEILYARLRLRQWKKTYEIDVRPSDALPLALLANAPILVAERVLRRLR